MYMYQLAQEHEGLLVGVEHRFYGNSFPTADTSVDSLQYLTSDQALADLARLLHDLMVDLDTINSKVITIGGSYSGNLAAWFRLKYPAISTGSIASSGPLTAGKYKITHIHIHIYILMYIYLHIYILIHTYMNIPIPNHALMFIRILIHILIRTYT